MLDTLNMVTFIPTTDYDKARPFYETVLGLRFVKDDGFAVVFDAERTPRGAPDCHGYDK